MSELIYELINVPALSTGRRLHALDGVAKEAKATSDMMILPLVKEALAHDARTLELEQAWERTREAPGKRGEAVKADQRADTILGVIYEHAQGHVKLHGDGAKGRAASKLLQQLFVGGLAPVITLVFEEQLAKNDAIIARMQGDLAPQVKSLGFGDHLAALEEANEVLRAELRKAHAAEVSFDQVSAARDRGNLYLRQIIARVLGTHVAASDEDEALRARLLAPILEQVRRVQESRRGRRVAPDVDPQTGAELPQTGDGARTE